MMIRAALLVGLLAAIATAGTTRTLQFKDGKKKTVVLENCDDTKLVYSQAGTKTEIKWDALMAASAYEARKELTSYDDADARLALAEFARRLKLYPEAMEQYEIALALGGLDETSFEEKAEALLKEEIAYLTGLIDALLKKKAEPTTCLAAIKRLKQRYPDHPKNEEYTPHIQSLVDILAKEKQNENDALAKQADSKEMAALRKQIEKLEAKRAKALAKAKKLRDESADPISKRSISGVKKKLLAPRGAERYYKDIRKLLREMVKVDRQFRIVDKKELQKADDATAAALVECYLPVARLLMRDRNYKGAAKMVEKILFYDPIHEEAMEMGRKIRKNRISFKASDITGIKGPIVSPR